MLLASSAWFHHVGWIAWTGFAVILAGLVLAFVRTGRLRRPAIEVRSPVTGRWLAVNSPADKVPSHGTHEYGQAYAIDLVHQPDPEITWKGVHAWPLARRPETFPAFGRPILAPADGVVVRVSRRQRDHWSRNSWPAVLYLLVVEGLVRGTLGMFVPSLVLGNHVILDLGDGCTRRSRTCGGARCGYAPASGSGPASSSPRPGTRATPPSRTCIPADGSPEGRDLRGAAVHLRGSRRTAQPRAVHRRRRGDYAMIREWD